ncbi:uncharacterized protein BO88DRAFT_8059 [Aspergillus vadensis CBS 113365]|uniref:Uncharacterized protein n=1 Tax=Aspergillus vadensis (strain CBS 113365 / IMI 142717 / IBT 24658) TaxID=1448311 RepID=A0A319BM05_ASPVC|nr:hypothetical protein BO88DRAFT_8059 [Aspergillus vadensis CBS 113365]PYH74326.1 hypothetical protein BO88DRAFT_8059 [Aspergillus vadensis CBS 113365]
MTKTPCRFFSLFFSSYLVLSDCLFYFILFSFLTGSFKLNWKILIGKEMTGMDPFHFLIPTFCKDTLDASVSLAGESGFTVPSPSDLVEVKVVVVY